ncbi:MAG: SpoIIE family protein phosphatase [Bacteroidales bacterium]|nr:SpoIIE family protein phosphatase [Bacteroidales bacterium]MBO7488334.1 SpoIIE family protein phosphatase [Bacteroidales bacterium]
MKKNNTSPHNTFRKSIGTGVLLIAVAALTLEATSLLQNYFTREGLKEEAQARASGQLEATRLQIVDATHQAEAAVRNTIWIARWCLNYLDSLPLVASRLVEDNPTVMGSTVALVPNYSRRRPLYAPYAYRLADTIAMKSLATQEYNYPTQPWFTRPLELDRGFWSEPYLDTGGGDIVMTTYSIPIKDLHGKQAAVLTADISLKWLAELIGSSQVYPNSLEVVVSRDGRVLISNPDGDITIKTLDEVAAIVDDTPSFARLVAEMRADHSGSIQIEDDGKLNHVFYAPVEQTGWSMAIVVPDDEIYGSMRRVRLIERLLQLLGLGMLIMILRITAKNQMKYHKMNEKKERMESELRIGRDIQMSMIPNTFPPFPERDEIDLAACLIPAKEVGGDLYDFFIRDNKLFFCIGDVSGKGVPASLVMAVTRSLFRSISAHEKSPQRIVTMMNEAMAEMNENNMFVTFFLGILDLETGHMRYCNAGHNPPLILSDRLRTLDVVPNLPLGVICQMAFQEQETDMLYNDTLLLYTDGLNEAVNSKDEEFTMERVEAAFQKHCSANEHLETMKEAVSSFVGNAPQSDDLTMLFIHYMNDTQPYASERHLILHNDIQQIPQLASFVETIAAEMKIEQNMAMGLNLALEEAVTNVILYAYPPGSDGLVDIEAIMRKGQLDFIITDSGVPFDPTQKPEVDITASLDERPIGGLGIHLVRQLMDSVSYRREDGKNILTLIKMI